MAAITLIISTIMSVTIAQPMSTPEGPWDPDWVYEAQAMFWKWAEGDVTIINGNIMIDLDITNVSQYFGVAGMGGIPSDCVDKGVYVYIHQDWNNDEDYDYMGRGDCDDDQTGDHFDPWYACSTASGGGDCSYNGGCIPPSSFINYEDIGSQYRCNDSIYEEYPYACEIGDMRKHEKMLSVSGSKKIKENYKSLWEMNGMDIGTDFSVVFHCSDEERTPFLCAPFTTEHREKMSSDPIHLQDEDSKISVNFNGLEAYGNTYNGIKIEQGQGWIRYTLPEWMSENCTMWSAYIMSEWKDEMDMIDDMDMPRYDEWCDMMYTGGVYDPTYSCINNDDGGMESGNMYCTDGTRCPDDDATDVDYECDNYENALKCAAGHMTGKTGYIYTDPLMMDKDYDMTFSDRTSPPLRDLVGRSVLLKCESENAFPMKLCAPIKASALSLASTNEEITGVTAGGVMAIVIIILLGIGITSAYCYGKKHGKSMPQKKENNSEKFAVLSESSPRTDNVVGINSSDNNASEALVQPPLATGGAVAYAPPPSNNESVALPHGSNDEVMGTMNEGGYLDGNEEEDEDMVILPSQAENNEYYQDQEVQQ